MADVRSEPVEATEPAGDGGGPRDDDVAGRYGEAGARPGLSWGRVVVLALALTFLGFGLGMFVSRDRPPGDGSVEVGFARDMITHHQQALRLASAEVTAGEDGTVVSHAREVLTFQSYEVGAMSQWLLDWGYPVDDRPDEAMGWMGMPVPYEEMSGLLTDEQMEAMTDATGAEADRLFLELMAEHHRGGIEMARHAAEHAEDDEVRALASRMVRNQTIEINEYRAAADRAGLDVDIEPIEVPAT